MENEETNTEVIREETRFEKKKRRFLSHPAAAGILLVLWAFVVQAILGAAFSAVGSLIFKITGSTLPEQGSDIITAYSVVIAALLMLFIHSRYFRPDYKGSFRKEGLKDKKSLIAMGVFLLVDAVVAVFGILRVGFSAPSAYTLAIALMAGVGEETSYRAIPVSAMMHTYGKKGSYLPALIISSVIFGLIHLSNIAAGAALPITLLQVISAAISGAFFCAIYLRTGNIFLTMLLHFLHDLMSFCMATQSTGILTMEVTTADYMENAVIAILQILLTIWLLKGQNKKISEVWKERWSRRE